MTRKEYEFCIEQRKRGKTYEWIAERLGCSVKTVYKMVKSGYSFDRFGGISSVHPGLEAWRKREGYTVSRICKAAGIPYAIVPKLNGSEDPERLYLREIRKILAFTGCTFEEIFGQEGNAP